MILNKRLLSTTITTVLARKPGKAMDLTDYVLGSSFFMGWTVKFSNSVNLALPGQC